MPDAPAIDLHEVTKNYGKKVRALNNIEMRVSRGEVFGLLGPNGAGKSTLVKIMMTVVHPTRCRGTVLGSPIGQKSTLARVGYLPENHRFPRYLTGRQILHFFGSLAKVERAKLRRRADELLELVGMTSTADRLVSTYSKGMAQRIGLAHALMNDPELILLDEPTDGVDPVGRRDIREVLLRLRKEGKTIFINSHQLSELDALCDRVAILVAGEVRRQGSVTDLSHAGQRYEIEIVPTNLDQDVKNLRAAADCLALAPSPPGTPGREGWGEGGRPLAKDAPPHPNPLPRSTGGEGTEIVPPILRLTTTDPAAIQPVLDALRRSGCIIRRVQAIRPNLEELFFAAVDQRMPPPLPPPQLPPRGVA
jgi:ABC-2 type transport system ATP-binding protein